MYSRILLHVSIRRSSQERLLDPPLNLRVNRVGRTKFPQVVRIIYFAFVLSTSPRLAYRDFIPDVRTIYST